jgi:hypothetical protein
LHRGRQHRIVLLMGVEKDRERFRHLPEPIRPEDTVETVDAGSPVPEEDEAEERARMLRLAGA